MPIVGPTVIAEKLGVTPQRVSQLCHDGMPKVGRGQYDLDACLAWIADAREDQTFTGDRSLADERTRYYAAQADTAEYSLVVKKGEFIHQETAIAVFSNVVTNLVLALDSWVDRAPSAEDMKRRRECAWECRTVIQRDVESLRADSASVSGRQTAGLRNRRQVR